MNGLHYAIIALMENDSKTNKIKKEFGTAVRRKRHKMGISQEDFANRADIHRTYVSSIELGKVDIGISVAYKVAAALDTPLNLLIKDAEKNL